MQTTVEEVDPVTVKLTVEIEPERVSRALDRAVKQLADRVDIPGFRKGKAPRRLLEQHLGEGVIMQQAMEDSLTDFYLEALEAEELSPVADPEVEMEAFDEEEGCVFEATVEIRPSFEVPDHEGISVTHPDWEVTEEDVDEQLDRLREQYAEVEAVDRAAEAGDYITLDLAAFVDGEELEDARVEDAMYEIGSGGVTENFDEEIIGCEPGEEFRFTDVLPEQYPEYGGEEAELAVTVRDVRHKQLPELDDDFAITASEFDTIEELREDIRSRLLQQSITQAQGALRSRVIEAYVANAELPLPAAMVDNEVEARRSQVEQQAERYGISVEELLSMEGEEDPEQFEEDTREQARTAVKSRLVLDALAEHLEIEVTEDDATDEIAYHAQEQGVDPEQVAEMLAQEGSVGALAGNILRRKTVDRLVDAAEVEGGPDRELLVELGLVDEEEAQEDSGLIVPGRSQAAGGGSELIVP